MRMQIGSDGIILVELPDGPETSRALDSVISRVHGREDDVVIDFSKVAIATSESLAPLLHLRELLCSHGNRVVLCGMNRSVKSVFSVTELDGVFEIAGDRDDALAALQIPSKNQKATETI